MNRVVQLRAAAVAVDLIGSSSSNFIGSWGSGILDMVALAQERISFKQKLIASAFCSSL